jgi:hypothetical protein
LEWIDLRIVLYQQTTAYVASVTLTTANHMDAGCSENQQVPSFLQLVPEVLE